jgi:hypothetical protein
MSEWDRQQQGRRYEGWAFTCCKAAFLVLLLGKYSLVALSGLATVFYVLAATKGVREWRCWAKPPYVTVFWAVIFILEAWRLWGQQWLPFPRLPHW